MVSDVALLEQLQKVGKFSDSPTDFGICITELEVKDVIQRVGRGREAKILPSITMEEACQSTAHHLIKTLPAAAVLPVVLILVQRFDLSQGLKDQIQNLLEMVMTRDS